MNYEKAKLRKIVGECNRHMEIMADAADCMAGFMPLVKEKYDNLSNEELRCMDQFLFRFSKFQDAVGQKLFKTLLYVLQEEVENRPFIDILNRLEKLELLEDKNSWMALRKIRNDLAHEYEDDSDELSQIINKIFEKRSELIQTFERIKQFCIQKGFLEVPLGAPKVKK